MSYRLLKRRCWINSRVHSGMQVGIFHITGGGHLGKQRYLIEHLDETRQRMISLVR